MPRQLITAAVLTPPEAARRLRVSADKIRIWIKTGELIAINVAARASGRPRYRIAVSDLQAFEERRRSPARIVTQRRKRMRTSQVIEFF